MSIVRRKWPRVEEFWFDEPVAARGVDVALLIQRASLPDGVTPTAKHTLVVDLRLPDDQLLANMHHETRHQIRRAQKDGLEFRAPFVPDDAETLSFCDFYSHFAADKGRLAVSLGYLKEANQAGALRLSAMSHGGEVLVRHSHLLIGRRARLWHSASMFRGQDSQRRNMIGRANRLLHWLEMQSFRLAGADLYDFGGWYAGDDDEEKLRINRFKEGFGGTPLQESQGVQPLTPLGRAYVWAQQLRTGG